jgi:hypothetical protein
MRENNRLELKITTVCLELFLLCLGNEHLVSRLQQFLMSYPVRGDVYNFYCLYFLD